MDINVLFIAFTLSCLLHFGIKRTFIFFRKFDDINYRSSHKTLATRTGGIGIFLTTLIISVYHYLQGIEIFDYSLFIPLGIIFITGVYDDLYNADFKLKFLLQIIVAKILIDQGFVITNYHGLFGFYEIPWLLAQTSTIFVFLIIINAINFIDGIDGLAITEVIKIIFLIEYFCLDYTPIAPLGAIIIATIFPLYYFNFKRTNKIFLGDGGSLFLGCLIATYIIYVLGDSYNYKINLNINKTIFTILILIYPLLDLFRVFLIRILAGKSPFEPDQNHLHHLLVRRFSPFQSVFLILISSLIIFFLQLYLNE